MRQDMILVLDLGSEENPRLAREIRALGVYSEIHPHDITKEELEALPNVKGIILNGGPNRVVDGVGIDVSQDIYNAPVPVLMADHKGDAPWPEDEQARKRPCPTLYSAYAELRPTGTWRTSLLIRWN